jgi:transposase
MLPHWFWQGGRTVSKPLISDELWEVIEPLLPPLKRSRKGGRPPLSNRAALTGILFVLRSGIPWEMLPQEMGCGCGMTCWRRLRDWQAAGVWDRLHLLLLNRLNAKDALDWSRAIVDSSSVRAVGAGQKPDRIPRIGRNRERSITSSRMAMAFRWRPRRLRPTPTMSPH